MKFSKVKIEQKIDSDVTLLNCSKYELKSLNCAWI